MLIVGVLEHFRNLQIVKTRKTCVSILNALFWGTEVANGFVTKASIQLLWTLNVDWGSFGAFHKPAECKKV
jgi:hypothetical protein